MTNQCFGGSPEVGTGAQAHAAAAPCVHVRDGRCYVLLDSEFRNGSGGAYFIGYCLPDSVRTATVAPCLG